MSLPAAQESGPWRFDGVPARRAAGSALPVDAVTIGEALVAFISTDGRSLVRSQDYRRAVVGAEYNVAVGLARLGHRVVFGGRVGDDPFGRAIEADAGSNEIVLAVVRDPEAPTGVIARDVQAVRPTTVQYARRGSAGSRLGRADLGALPLSTTRLLHVSGITAVLSESAADAVAHAVSAVRAGGGCVSFDPNLRRQLMGDGSRDVLVELVAQAHVLFAGVDELAWLAGTDDRRAGVEWALARGPQLVVTKDGEHGSVATGAGRELRKDALPVPVLDPVGAGDAFAAGFLSGLLKGHAVHECLAEATEVAALVVVTAGDTDGLPEPALLEAFRAGAGQAIR